MNIRMTIPKKRDNSGTPSLYIVPFHLVWLTASVHQRPLKSDTCGRLVQRGSGFVNRPLHSVSGLSSDLHEVLADNNRPAEMPTSSIYPHLVGY